MILFLSRFCQLPKPPSRVDKLGRGKEGTYVNSRRIEMSCLRTLHYAETSPRSINVVDLSIASLHTIIADLNRLSAIPQNQCLLIAELQKDVAVVC